MKFVYLLRSKQNPTRIYIGICKNIKNRLADHNSGQCKSTSEARPWQVDIAVYFSDENKAHRFERYLKSGSGRSFSNRHF